MIPVGSSVRTEGSYAEDRALIEDLQSRYMFAMDFNDLETFVSLFSKDGILDVGAGLARGRDAIRQLTIERIKKGETQEADDPASKLHRRGDRHHLTNIVVKIDGDRAVGRSYWFHAGNANPERTAVFMTYGHYEDEFVKVNGEWLFSFRKVFNENSDKLFSRGGNPAW
jgi:hypothetical protein